MAKDKATHHTVITSDQPVNVVVGEQTDDRWFRVFCAFVDKGDWAELSPAAKAVYVVLAKYSGRVMGDN